MGGEPELDCHLHDLMRIWSLSPRWHISIRMKTNDIVNTILYNPKGCLPGVGAQGRYLSGITRKTKVEN